MFARHALLAAALCLVCWPALCAPRTWTDKTGKFSVEAELVEVKDGQARLKKADGKVVSVPVDRLSAADRQYLTTLDQPEQAGTSAATNKKVTDLLTKIQQESGIPAIAGAIVTSRGLVAVGVTGVRKRGTEVPATLDDKWHLGSNTKAMTAMLVASLVEQGRLKWDSTLADVFSETGSKIHADLQGVTIVQLLSHRSGLPANLELTKYRGDSGPRERQRAVLQELVGPPQSEPGSKFEYSNLGYIIVGAIVEKLTGKTWEENMREHVFGPLKMESAGFGGTGTPGKIDQPWGHMTDGAPVPQNGTAIDNPPVMGPAGRVHCTIQDWAKYVADHLGGLRKEPALLKNASYKKLSTPTFGGDYALGWVVTRRDWGGGDVLRHNGSNTWNFATVWVAPQRDFAVLVCCNQGQGGDVAEKATDAAAAALIGLYSRMAGN